MNPGVLFFQKGFFGGAQLKFGMLFKKSCPFLLYFDTQYVVKHTIVRRAGLYSRVGFNMSRYSIKIGSQCAEEKSNERSKDKKLLYTGLTGML